MPTGSALGSRLPAGHWGSRGTVTSRPGAFNPVLAALAAEAHLPVVPHSANLSLVAVFTLHLLAAIPNAGPYMEFSIEPNDWARELYAPLPEVHDGVVAVPAGPGWGVQVNPDRLEAAEGQLSA